MIHQTINEGCQQDKRMKSLNRNFLLMEKRLCAKYGREFTNNLQREVRDEHAKLILHLPQINAGVRESMFNSFLFITAQELAVYKVMERFDRPPEEAWALCHETLRRRLLEIPKWKRRAVRIFMFSCLWKFVVKRRAGTVKRSQIGSFELEYLIDRGSEFDFGVNYYQCGNLNFVREQGGEAFAPYICLSDISLSDAFGWGLKRTQTLADGYPYCDFRFRKGETTEISSMNPQVQETIQRIRQKESEAD